MTIESRAALAVATSMFLSGCSWAFMTKPPEVVAAPNYPLDCTTSRAAPVLDTICVGYFIANGIYLAAVPDCASAGFGERCASSSTKTGGMLLSAGLGLLCGFSAASGYGFAARCEQKKDLNALCISGDQQACRTLRPGWAPSGAVNAVPAPPDVARGCSKDTDCKGDRICVSGACVSPPPAAPNPAQPKAPACEEDSDCAEGICFDGACRK